MATDDKASDDTVLRNIEQLWHGGEHANAGKRASLFMQGKGKAARTKIETELQDRCPGIQSYYVKPGDEPRKNVPDDPLANPETDPRVVYARDGVPTGGGAVNTGPSDVSSAEGKAETRAVEKALEPGRKVDEKAKR